MVTNEPSWRQNLMCFVKFSTIFSSFYVIRYGLVVRISGSHPGGPGSIPGVGNFLNWQINSLFYVYAMVNVIKLFLEEINILPLAESKNSPFKSN